jgi:hypothetical protein
MAKFIDLNQIKNRNEYLVKKLEDGEKSKIYKKIYLEIKQKKFDPEIYVKSLQTAKGNEQEAVAEYIGQRFEQLFSEIEYKKIIPFRNKLVKIYDQAVEKVKFKRK